MRRKSSVNMRLLATLVLFLLMLMIVIERNRTNYERGCPEREIN